LKGTTNAPECFHQFALATPLNALVAALTAFRCTQKMPGAK
jgi:hypothetical protein